MEEQRSGGLKEECRSGRGGDKDWRSGGGEEEDERRSGGVNGRVEEWTQTWGLAPSL